MTRIHFYRQADSMDCGPTSLRIISASYGRQYSQEYLREICYITRQGVNLNGISEAAKTIGFQTLAVKVSFDGEEASLMTVPLPAIAHWNQNHFVVVYKAKKNKVWIADPAVGKIKLSREEFKQKWVNSDNKGILLLLEPTPNFYSRPKQSKRKYNFEFIIPYLKPYNRLYLQIALGIVLLSLLQLGFPFLTQALVDLGVKNRDIDFVYLILSAQLMLFVSQTSIQFIQSWIILHVSARINIALIADYLNKLMLLPIRFFDSKNIGDLIQRITDHRRVESFLTNSSLNILFSSISLVVFSIVLTIYNSSIFIIFLSGSILYILWILLFLKIRKKIDYLAFQHQSDNNDSILDIIQGMTEIKLQGSQNKRRLLWTQIQTNLFHVNIKSLALVQYQEAGAMFITRLKDILIIFVVAKSVIDDEMTFGMMLAVQFIVGQVNAPLLQIVGFIRSAQDASISLERLSEIHDQDNENSLSKSLQTHVDHQDIHLQNLSFRYSQINNFVLNGITILIPKGQITAIVGGSGSGKTTLVKLLLRFYDPEYGGIKIGAIPLTEIDPTVWREQCGAVMQDGFIFSDTIANNIAESDQSPNIDRLNEAIVSANLEEFINKLPLAHNTIIGSKGMSISQGQKQRILIARAIYKNPMYLFLDEATNSLDAINEKLIMENLKKFYEGRTVVVVAHRLSTVKNADKIIVLDNGRVIEVGNHDSLIQNRGKYYNLIKNQLDLD